MDSRRAQSSQNLPPSDLISLLPQQPATQPPSDDAIATLLIQRLRAGQPYTRLGNSTLIFVNPFRQLGNLGEEMAKEYEEACYRDTSGQASRNLQPHIFDLAARVYFSMRRGAIDQSVVFSGLTGSGKSDTAMHFTSQLIRLSSHNSQKQAKFRSQIQGAYTILESLGHARTPASRNASKFGKYQEIQFNERGRISGLKTLVYCFDQGRVSGAPSGERNYHVFYDILAGLNTEEKSTLGLAHPPEYFVYLRGGATTGRVMQDWNEQNRFDALRVAMSNCGFKPPIQTQVFQLLAAILHLGNLQFVDLQQSLQSSQDSCEVRNRDVLEYCASLLGISADRLEQTLTNKLKLIRKELCTIFLQSREAGEQRDAFARALYAVLFAWVVESLNKRLCVADEDKVANFIGILDQFGFQNTLSITGRESNSFEQFCINFANERLRSWVLRRELDDSFGVNAVMVADGIELIKTPTIDYEGIIELIAGKDNLDSSITTSSSRSNILALVDAQTTDFQTGSGSATNANLLVALERTFDSNPSFQRVTSRAYHFALNHFSGTEKVEYTVDQFLEKNLSPLSPDFVNLLRSPTGCSNVFVRNLFSSPVLSVESHARDSRTIVRAQVPSRPMRKPSTRRTGSLMRRGTTKEGLLSPIEPISEETTEDEKKSTLIATQIANDQGKPATVLSQLDSTLRQIRITLDATKVWNVVCLRPLDDSGATIKAQVRAYALAALCHRKTNGEWSVPPQDFHEFLTRYDSFVNTLGVDSSRSPREAIEALASIAGWTAKDIVVGREFVWLNEIIWRGLEDELRREEKGERRLDESAQQVPLEQFDSMQRGRIGSVEILEEQRPGLKHHESKDRLLSHPGAIGRSGMGTASSFYGDEESYYDPDGRRYDDDRESRYDRDSDWGEKAALGGEYGLGFTPTREPEEHIEEIPVTAVRRWWIWFVWLMTWWVPTSLLRILGKMKREDVRIAWREKVTLCILIFSFSGVMIFWIVGLGLVLCPGTKTLYSDNDVLAHQTLTDFYVSVRGKVYDATRLLHSDHSGSSLYPSDANSIQAQFFGIGDLSYYFPIPMTQACPGLITTDAITITPNGTLQNAFIHTSGTTVTNRGYTQMQNENWYFSTFLPYMQRYLKGDIVIDPKEIQAQFLQGGRKWGIIDNKVYDISQYFATAQSQPVVAGAPNYHYLDSNVEAMFNNFAGGDMTAEWDRIVTTNFTQDQYNKNWNCLNNAFYIGRVDYRQSVRCVFNNYLLLAFACIMAALILVKFLAALQLGGAPTPEEHDKFVICQVPCYTEGEEGLRKTIQSLTALNYDDKRKLLFIICDGMIVGGGNERPTPAIVLDILGADTRTDPEPVMFKSIGEGSKQLNYGKVYSGLYDFEGHVVPYIVVVKIGKPSERSRPGNRGKRDSQMVLMRFLNKVHFDSDMNPLELEIFYQMKHIIGVDPNFYEYVLQVDADTEVMPDSLNLMMSEMIRDGKIVGICGETKLANEDNSWTTMIQVYEYYISHHLSKAFESLFGTVTCLPGCFSMYRIRDPVKHKPLIISDKIIKDYSENHVDTLHKKNLLSLGEDRYLTTLILKYFPDRKTTFTPYAQCQTAAPDRWSILLSQRRRWINSTIHNLLELLLMGEMCGFCLFSMRFVVFIDLIGTLTMPATVVYLFYQIIAAATQTTPLPIISLAMLAGVYGLQALVFILKRQWQHVGWMIIYIIAFPVFGFFIPIYSFWRFDDFSWGNTRVVVESGKKQIYVADDEVFDEKMIPMKRWAIYEDEVLERQTAGTHESWGTRITEKTTKTTRSKPGDGGSLHISRPGDGGSIYGGRSADDTASAYGGSSVADGFDYYRDTNVLREDRKSKKSGIQGPAYLMSGQAPSITSVPPSEYGDYVPIRSLGYRGSSAGSDYEAIGARMGLSRHSTQRSVPPVIEISPLGPDMPTEQVLTDEIKNILSSVDLMTATKKQVREQLSNFFGVNLDLHKDYVNRRIDLVLQKKV